MSPAINPNLLDTGTPPIPEAYAWTSAYDGSAGPLMNMAQAAPGSPPPPELLEQLAKELGAEVQPQQKGFVQKLKEFFG